MKRISGMPKNTSRNNVIDFSKKKRDLSHIQRPKNTPPRKKIKINYSKLIKYISVIILLLLLSASIYAFVDSEYALIQEITVTREKSQGNFLLEEQEILQDLPKEGQANFFRTPKEYYIEIVTANPWIKDVEVTKNYLDRSVNIHVEERRPLFRTLSEDSEYNIISEDGMVLPNREGVSGANVPYIIGSDNQVELERVIAQLKTVPDDFLINTSEINIENMNSVNLYTMDGFIIRVGLIENLTSERVEEIQKIIELEKNRGNTGSIDIRGNNIIFKSKLEG